MKKIEEYAEENFIPIMQKEGIDYLINFIKENKIYNILELGSAIGYSAIKMALVDENINIVTIERDVDRYNEALKNINEFNLNNQIKIINNDIFDVDIEDKFDLIFIDAAKGQNIRFFNKFKNNLNKNGYIITDNIKFHGLVENVNEIKSRNLRQMIRKIDNYIKFLEENEEFKTEFIDIGDGLSISSWR